MSSAADGCTTKGDHMNEAYQKQLFDYWHKNTCHLNEQIDDAFKLAQDQAYELGLKRGMGLSTRFSCDNRREKQKGSTDV